MHHEVTLVPVFGSADLPVDGSYDGCAHVHASDETVVEVAVEDEGLQDRREKHEEGQRVAPPVRGALLFGERYQHSERGWWKQFSLNKCKTNVISGFLLQSKDMRARQNWNSTVSMSVHGCLPFFVALRYTCELSKVWHCLALMTLHR